MTTLEQMVDAGARAMGTDQMRKILYAAGMEWPDGQDVLLTKFTEAALCAALPIVAADLAELVDGFRCGACGMDGKAAAALRARLSEIMEGK